MSDEVIEGQLQPPKPTGDGVIHGTAGGPYCGVCGAPAERDEVDATDWGGTESTLYGPWTCPNRCDPRKAQMMTTWRLDPDTYALVIDDPPPSGAYTLAQISAIARPSCPLCGTQINIDAVDISTSQTGPGAIYVPGAMSCPNGCDPIADRRRAT